MLEPEAISASLVASFDAAERVETPFPHWLPMGMLPGDVVQEIDALPGRSAAYRGHARQARDAQLHALFLRREGAARSRRLRRPRPCAAGRRRRRPPDRADRRAAARGLPAHRIRARHRGLLARAAHRHRRQAVHHADLPVARSRRGRVGHGPLRRQPQACDDRPLPPQLRPHLRAVRDVLARLPQAPDPRRAPLADRQLREAGVARPARTGVPGQAGGAASVQPTLAKTRSRSHLWPRSAWARSCHSNW